MVEVGIGMIVVCLPTLRPLFHGWSPETILNSIRSAISLRSMNGSGGMTRLSESKGSPKGDSNSSITRTVKQDNLHLENRDGIEHVEAFAMGPRAGGSATKTPPGTIRVENNMMHTIEHV